MARTVMQELAHKLQSQQTTCKPQQQGPIRHKGPPAIKGPRAVQSYDQAALRGERQK